MKRIFALLIAFVFVVTLFTACTETTITPTNTVTDTKVPVEKQEVVSLVDVMDDIDSSVPQAVENQPEENKKVVEDSVSKIQVSSSNPVNSQAESKVTSQEEGGNQTNGMPSYRDQIYFKSIDDFENWLKNGDQKASLHAEIMGNVQMDSPLTTTTYYRPKMGSGNERLELSYINAFSDIMYVGYLQPKRLRDDISFGIPLIGNPQLRILEALRNNIRKEGASGVKTANGLKYEYFCTTNAILVYWEQDGLVFRAQLSYDIGLDLNDEILSEVLSYIDEILPYLQVEKVGYKANDHVTQ